MNTTAATKTIAVKCGKCKGTGHIAVYAGIDNGRCWGCAGAGVRFTTAVKETRNAKARKARAAANDAKREDFMAAKMREAHESGMTLRDWHDNTCGCGDFCSETWNDGATAKAWAAAIA